LVGGRHQAVLEVLKILPVRVPEVLAVVVPVDGHQWHAEFDQPPGQQQALTVDVAAVLVAEVRRLFLDVERGPGSGRGQRVQRPGLVRVPRRRRGTGMVGLQGQHFAAAIKPREVHALGQAQSRDAKSRGVGVAFDAEGIVSLAQPARILTGSTSARCGRVGDGPGHRDAGGQRPLTASRPEPADECTEVGRVIGRRTGRVGVGRRGQVAGQRAMGARKVGRVVVSHRADDRQAIGAGREQGEMLADPHAGQAGRDRGEAAPDLDWRIRLGIPGIELAGPASLEDHDTGAGLPKTRGTASGWRRGSLCLLAEQRGEAQARDGQRSRPENLATCQRLHGPP